MPRWNDYPDITQTHPTGSVRMPKPSRSPDPMAREVDRLLAQLERSGPQPRISDASHNGSLPKPAITPKPTRAVSPGSSSTRGPLIALWARVLLGIGLGAVMTQWPYPHGCGLALAGYLGAIGIVMLSGAWIAFESWKLRSGVPHILSLILFYWGIVLAAEQLLPRVGYAATAAGWGCTP
jgi:hypothetical protein